MKIIRTVIAWIATSFLLVVLGAIVTWGNVWPFDPHLRNAFIGLQALMELTGERDDADSDVWMPSGDAGGPTGVLRNEPGAYDGYTLIAVGEAAYLIDLDGEVVHAWSLPYASLPPGERLRRKAPSVMQLYWKPARLLPDGDLLAIVDLMGASPEGLALLRLDPDSQPRWVYHGSVHHDFDVGDDGRIYVLDQRITKDPVRGLPALVPPLLDEGVVVLSPSGKREKRISLVAAFAASPYARMVDLTARESHWPWGDYLHSNNIDILAAGLADSFNFLEPGQALISLREINTVAVLDVEQQRIVWALRGDWFAQHDPDFLPNGRLVMFDNLGDWLRGAAANRGYRLVLFRHTGAPAQQRLSCRPAAPAQRQYPDQRVSAGTRAGSYRRRPGRMGVPLPVSPRRTSRTALPCDVGRTLRDRSHHLRAQPRADPRSRDGSMNIRCAGLGAPRDRGLSLLFQ
jgi:hypothetical protein